MQSRNNLMSNTNITGSGTGTNMTKKLNSKANEQRASGINGWHELTSNSNKMHFNTIDNEPKLLKKNKSSVRKIVFHNLPGN